MLRNMVRTFMLIRLHLMPTNSHHTHF